MAGANEARLVSAAGDAFLSASGANGSVVLGGGAAIFGAAPTVSFSAAGEGSLTRGVHRYHAVMRPCGLRRAILGGVRLESLVFVETELAPAPYRNTKIVLAFLVAEGQP